MTRPLILIGMMGAGKSATAEKLGAKLTRPVRDCDQEIEAEHGTIEDIFTELGEETFRKIEEEMVKKILTENPSAVIALGGGAYLSAPVRKACQDANALVVWLKADADTILKRLDKDESGAVRPLLAQAGDKKTLIQDLLEARLPFYEQADIVIEEQASPEAAALAILKAQELQ